MMTPLRPLTVGEVLDTTFSLYRKHFLLFVSLFALPQILILAIQLANIAVNGGQSPASWVTAIALGLSVLVATLVVSVAAHAATFVAVSDLYLGRQVTIGAAFSRIRGQIAGLAVLTIVLAIGIGIGLLLLIVPGVLLALRWSLAIPAAVLEQETIGGSMSRSATLTKGFRLRVLLVWFLFVMLMWIIAMVLSIPVMIAAAVTAVRAGTAAFGPAIMPGWVLVVNVVSSYVAGCLVGPLFAIGLAVLYYDLRVRKEAFDLELMMKAIDSGGTRTPDQAEA